MATNRWRGEVLRVAQGRQGINRMILKAAAEHVKTEEGLRVALGALCMTVDDAWIDEIKQRIAIDEQAATITATKGGA
jgi:hypothetical protein